MYTDILDQVTGSSSSGGGGGRGGRSGGRGGNTARAGGGTNVEDEIMVRFKAGRVSLETTATTISTTTGITDATTSATTAVNNKENENQFQCVARPERGEVRLVKSTSSSSTIPSYSWQWYSRTTETVVETISLLPVSTTASATKMRHTFERVTLPNKKMYEQDRVYVWTRIPLSSKKIPIVEEVEEEVKEGEEEEIESKPTYRMFWMQDADPSTDITIVEDVQQFFAEVAIAAVAAAAAASTTTSSASAATANQVDALSSILENLGMPQTSNNSATSMDTTSGMDAPPTNTATGRNQLTLADLQGAMASIQQQQQQQVTVGPPLQDLVTSQSIDAIMNHPEACQRLLQYLPAEQQSVEFLRDNLTSSSMQSTLRTLTQMLVQQNDDDTSNATAFTEYSNLIANFQLDPQDGESALLQNNNPIEAFLNCIIAAVEKEKDGTLGNEDSEANTADGNNDTKKDDDDNDVQMNE